MQQVGRPLAPLVPVMSIEAQVLERDGGRCFRCGAVAVADRWPGVNCHHRQLRSGGGPDTPENRITLCGSGTTSCHGWVHGHPAVAREQGWMVSRHSVLGPAGTPVRHHQLGMVFLTPDFRMLTPEQYAQEGRDGQG